MPIYKGTDSNQIQRVYKGGKECCVFKGNTLVHPDSIIHSTTETGDWYIPGAYFNGSANRIYKTLQQGYNPESYDSGTNVEWKQYGGLYYFDINTPAYYDIVWRATYRKPSGGGSYVGLRVHRYSWDPANNRYTNEYELGATSNVLVQATPVEIELVCRRQYLNGSNAILFTSNLGDNTVLESNAIVMINKVP